MKYFLLGAEQNNNPVPQLIDWYSKINPRHLSLSEAGRIPDWSLIEFKGSADSLIMDIISDPFLLLSEETRGTVQLYDGFVLYKQVMLMDSQASRLYYLPILEEITCLSPRSELSRGGNRIVRPVLRLSAIQKKHLFKVGGVSDAHIAVSLDLAESMIRRNIRGISLRETELEE